jgi:hypothetical protein
VTEISIEQLVETVVRQVLAELAKRGVQVRPAGTGSGGVPAVKGEGGTSLEIDMSKFRTPVLTENQLINIGTKVSTIIVPCTTVVTPGAWDIIKAKQLRLVRKKQSN